MTTKPFPPINLDPRATPNIKAMQGRIVDIENDLRRWKQAQGNSANSSTSTLALLSGKVQELQVLAGSLASAQDQLSKQQDGLTATTAGLKSATDLLTALANLQYDEWSSSAGTNTGAVGWTTSRASVRISTPTGRLEVGYGGSLNSGNGTFVYNVVGDKSGAIYGRDTVRSNYARRVAVSGGAAFIGSGFNTVVIDVPKDEMLTVTNQAYAESTTTYFFGAKVSARPAP